MHRLLGVLLILLEGVCLIVLRLLLGLLIGVVGVVIRALAGGTGGGAVTIGRRRLVVGIVGAAGFIFLTAIAARGLSGILRRAAEAAAVKSVRASAAAEPATTISSAASTPSGQSARRDRKSTRGDKHEHTYPQFRQTAETCGVIHGCGSLTFRNSICFASLGS